ncbi:MAG: hypothetical protein IPM39_04930 [Chloroflexi bacterium]|nr:hypothetical protein [Chloroflexota bacterium]
MSNDFSRFSDDSFDETPDWLLDDDATPLESATDDFETGGDDEFDQLRRKSTRTGSMQDEMEAAERTTATSSGGSFAWSKFTPGQRLVLALLILLNIIAVAFGVMVVAGII